MPKSTAAGIRQCLTQKTLSDDPFGMVIVTAVEFQTPLTRRMSPGFTRFIQFGKDAFVTHADPECHLRRGA